MHFGAPKSKPGSKRSSWSPAPVREGQGEGLSALPKGHRVAKCQAVNLPARYECQHGRSRGMREARCRYSPGLCSLLCH